MQNENSELLRTGYDAFMAGDMETLKNEVFASDIVWHTPGNNPTWGDRNGADSVLELFGKYFELTDGTFRVEVHDLLASDDHGVVLGKVYGQRNWPLHSRGLRSGQPFQGRPDLRELDRERRSARHGRLLQRLNPVGTLRKLQVRRLQGPWL